MKKKEKFIDDYKKILGADKIKKRRGSGDIYRDPDGSYCIKGKGKIMNEMYSDFYKKLATFLNAREESLKDRFKEQYKYEFEFESEKNYPGGIIVKKEIDNNYTEIFRLRSDQFAFSAPTKNEKHPYDLYLIKNEYDDEARQNVAKWILDSRTLFGCFLWPIRKCADAKYRSEYNRDRGGTIPACRNKRDDIQEWYYIQDRVDLTLLEIKHFYDPDNYPGDKLFKYYIDDTNHSDYESSHMKEWLEHFRSFENYVDFFILNNFVVVDDEKYRPINMITDEPLKDRIEYTQEIKSDIEKELLKKMLERLNEKIVDRYDNNRYENNIKDIVELKWIKEQSTAGTQF